MPENLLLTNQNSKHEIEQRFGDLDLRELKTQNVQLNGQLQNVQLKLQNARELQAECLALKLQAPLAYYSSGLFCNMQNGTTHLSIGTPCSRFQR